MKVRVQRSGQLLAPVVTAVPSPGGGGETSPPPAPTPTGGFSLFGPEAGGYVTGLDVADDGTMWARTDVGGVYRKAPGFGSEWVQGFTMSSVASPLGDDYSVDAVACSPTQPLHAYAATGSFYRVGRILRTTDGGATWTQPGASTGPGNGGFQIGGNEEWRYGRVPLAVQHDNTLVCWYGTRREGLWRTIDGGVNWTQSAALPEQVSTTNYHRTGVTMVLIERGSALSGNVRQGLWTAVHGKGIYRSTNGGTTWTLMHTIPSTSWVRDGMLDSNGSLVASIFNIESPSSVVRITTAGAVTNLNTPGLRFSSVAVHPTNPNTIFVASEGVSDNNLFRTTNGGTSWSTLTIGISNGTDGAVWPTQSKLDGYMSTGHIRFDPSDTSRLWFAEGMGMWWSNDLADSDVMWTFASRGIQELVANAIVKPPGTGAVAVTWDRGVWKWNASGRATLPASVVAGEFCSAWDVQQRPDNPQIMVAQVDDHQSNGQNANRRSSCISEDGGSTWARLAGLQNGTTVAGLRFGTIAMAYGNTDNLVWAPGPGYNADDMALPRYTTNRGLTWQTPSFAGLPSGAFVAGPRYLKQRKLIASQVTAGKFYCMATGADGTAQAGNSYLGVTTNGGASWTFTLVFGAGNYDSNFNCHLTAVKVGATERLYFTPGPRGDGAAARQSGGQYPVKVSSDLGATWADLGSINGVGPLGVGAPIAPSTNPTLFGYGWVGTALGLYRSTDLGATWTLRVNEPYGWYQGVTAMCGDPEVPGQVYVGMGGGSFFVGQP